MRKLSILALALSVLAVSCNKDQTAPEFASGEIRVTAGIGALTKVAYDGDKSAFEKGDQIAVYAWTGDATAVPDKRVVDGVVNTYDGELWNPKTQMLWKTVVDPHFFLGITPVHEIKDFTADPYELDPKEWQASDLLIARILGEGIKADSNPVPLNFDHAMARLDVNLSFRNQWTKELPAQTNTEALIASVIASAQTGAKVNYITKGITPTGDQADIPMVKKTNAAWTSLMVPQTGFTTITLHLEGNDEWWGGNQTHVFVSSTDIPLVSGKVTTVNLIVGRDQIEIGTITINDWTAGEAYPDGDAEETESGGQVVTANMDNTFEEIDV